MTQEEKMKDFKKLKGILLSAVIAIGFLASHSATAASYTSQVRLPVLHSKGFAYTSQLPITKAAKTGQKIMSVSWTWNVQGWPRGLEVSLCQGAARCIDVSRQRSGSTDAFNICL